MIGSPGDCQLLADGVRRGTSLQGAVNFFDTVIGDLAVETSFTCQ